MQKYRKSPSPSHFNYQIGLVKPLTALANYIQRSNMATSSPKKNNKLFFLHEILITKQQIEILLYDKLKKERQDGGCLSSLHLQLRAPHLKMNQIIH